jgi:hypothetical protein
MSHKFKIGQTVQLTRDSARLANNPGNFRILALRPVEGDDPHYLIKSDSERAQRIVAQSAIRFEKN